MGIRFLEVPLPPKKMFLLREKGSMLDRKSYKIGSNIPIVDSNSAFTDIGIYKLSNFIACLPRLNYLVVGIAL